MRDTVVSEDGFRLRLPGSWSRAYDEAEARWVFSAKSGEECLTVSMLGSSEPMSSEAQRRTLDKLLALRLRAEREVAENPVELSQPTKEESGETKAGRFEGIEQAIDRRFRCLILVTRLTVGTFYYEGTGLPGPEFDSHARAIMNTIMLTE